ncbi:MAG: protein translocase SEC61 complex subunit gamma [Candidatus Anstonellaceae archaeon]
MANISEFIKHCRRVMHVATLPRKKEFEMIVKISVIGVLIIGLLSVVISALLNII